MMKTSMKQKKSLKNSVDFDDKLVIKTEPLESLEKDNDNICELDLIMKVEAEGEPENDELDDEVDHEVQKSVASDVLDMSLTKVDAVIRTDDEPIKKIISSSLPPNRSKRLYTSQQMQNALNAKACGMSFGQAAKRFGVPKSTLHSITVGTHNFVPMGPKPLLSTKEEDALADWLIGSAKRGFLRSKTAFYTSVSKIMLASDPNREKFKNGRPSDGYLRNFLRRNPGVSLYTKEAFHVGRAIVDEAAIREWFDGIHNFLSANVTVSEFGLNDMMLDPNRVFNCDETNFQISSKTGKVLGPKRWRNVYECNTKYKDTLTVLGTFCANGDTIPGMFVYPYIRAPLDIVKSVGPDWGIGKSATGWMLSETFYEYIAKVFDPWLVGQKVPKPVILFLDGLQTHVTLEVNQLCADRNIVLYCLLPNSKHILQPAHVAVFGPMKKAWRKTIIDWRITHPNQVVSTKTFAPVVLATIKAAAKKETIRNCFIRCGLFPLNRNNVDYAKCGFGTLGSGEARYYVPVHEKIKAADDKFFRVLKEEFGEDILVRFQAIKEKNLKPKENELPLYRLWDRYTSDPLDSPPARPLDGDDFNADDEELEPPELDLHVTETSMSSDHNNASPPRLKRADMTSSDTNLEDSGPDFPNEPYEINSISLDIVNNNLSMKKKKRKRTVDADWTDEETDHMAKSSQKEKKQNPKRKSSGKVKVRCCHLRA